MSMTAQINKAALCNAYMHACCSCDLSSIGFNSSVQPVITDVANRKSTWRRSAVVSDFRFRVNHLSSFILHDAVSDIDPYTIKHSPLENSIEQLWHYPLWSNTLEARKCIGEFLHAGPPFTFNHQSQIKSDN